MRLIFGYNQFLVGLKESIFRSADYQSARSNPDVNTNNIKKKFLYF